MAAPLADVAGFLVDAQRISRCVPGVESVEEVGNGEYRATLQARLGPVAAAFQGTLRLDDSEAPNRLSAFGEGHDQRSGSQAKVEFTADLEEDDGETVVRAHADVAIRGRLGQFGTGVINSTAREMVREFAQCINNTLSGSADDTVAASRDRQPSSLLRVGFRGVWTWLVGVVRTGRTRLRALFVSGKGD